MGEGASPVRAEVLAAREAVLAARGTLDEELIRLEASARAAVDIPAKMKRHPVRTTSIVAGAGFLVLGGPKKLFRLAKRAVVGPEEPLPVSLLPKEIDRALESLGSDGERVRGVIEREFASYLEVTQPARRNRNLRGAFTVASVAFLRPLALRLGKQVADQVFATNPADYDVRLRQIRARLGATEKQDRA